MIYKTVKGDVHRYIGTQTRKYGSVIRIRKWPLILLEQ
jgi:hypothetical protein